MTSIVQTEKTKTALEQFSDRTLNGADRHGVPCQLYLTRDLMALGFQSATGDLIRPFFQSFDDKGEVIFITQVGVSEVEFRLRKTLSTPPRLTLSIFADGTKILTATCD